MSEAAQRQITRDDLYRYLHYSPLGYLVYRAAFDPATSSLIDAAVEHKVAVFVDEDTARDYCVYRNEMTCLYDSDNVALIRHNDTPEDSDGEEDWQQTNRRQLREALDALYCTFVTDRNAASHRGDAIQAINSMARVLGYPDIVRTD